MTRSTSASAPGRYTPSFIISYISSCSAINCLALRVRESSKAELHPATDRDRDRTISIAGYLPRSAIFRSSTICPSSKPRIASETGSLKSSPSTSTVNIPVIYPVVLEFTTPGPTLSINFERLEKTLMGYPRDTGASPAERAISLNELQYLVMLSTISKTLLPLSRKYSDIVSADKVANVFIEGELSDVATTMMVFFIFILLRLFSINSLTSFPLSPIIATTVMSHSVLSANMPTKVDFPTPEPANTPSLCPCRQVVKRFNATTPRSIRSPSLARLVAKGGSR